MKAHDDSAHEDLAELRRPPTWGRGDWRWYIGQLRAMGRRENAARVENCGDPRREERERSGGAGLRLHQDRRP